MLPINFFLMIFFLIFFFLGCIIFVRKTTGLYNICQNNFDIYIDVILFRFMVKFVNKLTGISW